jgi:hypothetical protein
MRYKYSYNAKPYVASESYVAKTVITNNNCMALILQTMLQTGVVLTVASLSVVYRNVPKVHPDMECIVPFTTQEM